MIRFRHEQLGTLEYQDEGWWSGTQSTHHGDIEIIVVGSTTEPDATEAVAGKYRFSFVEA